MTRKRILISFLLVLFTVAVGMLCRYFMLKRDVSTHASCIPKNAIAVISLNSKAMIADLELESPIFFDNIKRKSNFKNLEAIIKAIELNNGAGLNETSEILAFFYQNNDAAFIGIVAALKDSLAFGKLIRQELSKQYSIQISKLSGLTIANFDTSAAALSWNKTTALYILPFSNHGYEDCAAQCVKLLKQAEGESILSNKNFKTHSKLNYDAGIWMQAAPLLNFTDGGKLFRVALENINTISLALNFQNGEVIINRIIENEKKNNSTPYNAPLLLTCDPKDVSGFLQIPLDFSNEAGTDVYVNAPPYNILPFSTEQLKELSKYLDGNCTVLIHDTLSYQFENENNSYIETSERAPTFQKRRTVTTGISVCFNTKNETIVTKLISDWMKKDSIGIKNNKWIINENGETFRLGISQNILTYTNWPQSDGVKREFPNEFKMHAVYYPTKNIFYSSNESILSFLLPNYNATKKLLSENIKLLTISKPTIINNTRTSQIRLIMTNKDINSIVQLEKLFQNSFSNEN